MNYTHVLQIVGDENDGDYVHVNIEFTPGASHREFIGAGQFIKNTPAKNIEQFANSLAEALRMPRSNKHNWQRVDPYDGVVGPIEPDAQETIYWLVRSLYSIDLSDIEYQYDEYAYSIVENMFEFINNLLLPFCLIGIHTISAIKMYKKNPCDLLYSQFDTQRRDVTKMATHVVKIENGALVPVNDKGDHYYDYPTSRWVPATSESKITISTLCKGKILWKK